MRLARNLSVLAAFGLSVRMASAALEYGVVDLGTLGGTQSVATGINDRGQVVGWSLDADVRTQAFLWQNGNMTGLGFFPGGTSSVANAINNNGEITGYSYVSATNYHAFLYVTNSLVDLGTLGGPNSKGLAINNKTEVAGLAYVSTNLLPIWYDAFWWRTNQMVVIPPYQSKRTCEGRGINENGFVSGFTVLDIPATDRSWGYVWHDDNQNASNDLYEMKLLGTLGGDYSEACAINEAGQTVGWAGITNTFYPLHAFLVTPSNGVWKLPSISNTDRTNLLMSSLGALESPFNNSYANAINDRTWIVGTSTTGSGTNQAFLWREGVMTNLNLLIPSNSGWVLTNATGINEHNEIVGSGLFHGQPRAFMLRQDGRITAMAPIVQTNLWIFTNEFDEVVTQTEMHVEAHVLQWAGIWGTNANTSHVFTVEYCDTLPLSNWAPVAPTAQWPIAENYWTNADFNAASSRFFRIRAQEGSGGVTRPSRRSGTPPPVRRPRPHATR